MYQSLTFERSPNCCDAFMAYYFNLEGIYLGCIAFDPSDSRSLYEVTIDYPGCDTIESIFSTLNCALAFVRATCEKLSGVPVLVDRVSWITVQIDPASPSRTAPGPTGFFTDELAITPDSDLSDMTSIRSYECATFVVHIYPNHTIKRTPKHGQL